MTTTFQKPLFEKRASAQGAYSISAAPAEVIRAYLRGCASTRFKTASSPMWWENSSQVKEWLRRYNPEQLKQASIGGDQEQGFEQAFSSLAYAYLKDKSPRLLDFIIGFQLVDRNEDNTKAMGVFGFKVGDQWLYAPVFFLNGDLKGHELLYIKKQDSFVPMKENWVNYLISRKPYSLGEPSQKSTHELGGLLPNLTRLTTPPRGAKYGSDRGSMPSLQKWSHDFLPLAFALKGKRAGALYPGLVKDPNRTLDFKQLVAMPMKAALAPSNFSLTDLLSDFGLLKLAYDECYRRYPGVKLGFDKFYGPNFFRKQAETSRQHELNQPSTLLRTKTASVRPQVKKASRFLIPPQEHTHPLSDGRLEIVYPDAFRCKLSADNKFDEDQTITKNRPDLTDAERERLMADVVLIRDKRDSHATSIAYNTQTRVDLTNPSDTGLYDVLEKINGFDEMLVIHNPHTGRGRVEFVLLVRKSDPRAWLNTPRDQIWTREQKPTSDFRTWVDGLSNVSDVKKDGVYVAIHQNGSGTCPFRVLEEYEDGMYRVEWYDTADYSYASMRYSPLRRSVDQGFFYGYDSKVRYTSKIRINFNKGSGLRSVNGELSIPDSYKIIELAKIDEPEDENDPKKNDSLLSCAGKKRDQDGDGSGGDEAEGSSKRQPSEPENDNTCGHKFKTVSKPRPIQPGNLVDLQLMLTEKLATLKLHDTGADEVWLTSYRGQERMTKTSALVSLVRDHGLNETQSRALLKAAAQCGVHNRSHRFYVKYAYGFGPMQPGPGAPGFPEPMRGSEQLGPNSVPAIYPQEEWQPVPGMDANMTDPSIYDPFYMPDQKAMQTAQQASQSGQKEVFDTSMISGLLKAVRQNTLVDRYLGDLMKALDRLGRLLFLFYWHQEEFEDRYGKQDLPELEDSIRNAFEVVGDVVLFLKEKTVQGGGGVDIGASVGDAEGAEPSVQEAARN